MNSVNGVSHFYITVHYQNRSDDMINAHKKSKQQQQKMEQWSALTVWIWVLYNI